MSAALAYRTGSSEFPHDNPACDAIAVWLDTPLSVVPSPEPEPPSAPVPDPLTARDSCIVPVAAASPPLESLTLELVPVESDDGDALLFASEPPPPMPETPAVALEPTGAFELFVRIASETAREHGGADAEAAVRAVVLGEDAVARAWRAILRGESDDVAACGEAMLDAWAASVIANACGAVEKAASLRSALRKRGVAAFGMLDG